MSWSLSQRSMLLSACTIAGINDRQRYLIMAHVGCSLAPSPAASGGGAAPRSKAAVGARPSVKDARNTHEQFEACMAIIEAQACWSHGGALPSNFPRPAKGTWADAERHLCERLRHRIREIFDQACRDLPDQFNAGSMPRFIERMTVNDTRDTGRPEPQGGVPVLNVIKPRTLEHLDAGQCYRVLEGAKAWIARNYRARDLRVPFTTSVGRASRPSSAPSQEPANA